MVRVVRDQMGSETHLYLKRIEIDETLWDNLLFQLGYEHVDSSDDILELTIIGSNIYNEEMNNA
tara:strand:- start:129 stop:320 length:192 start_codon:yes stop_codon:yes gene_type:complete